MDSTYAEVGTEVILGKPKTDLHGYWITAMEAHVGKRAKIQLVETHWLGYQICYVDVDSGVCYWRVQDMILASDVPLLTPEQRQQLNIKE
jgi:hypothetical protein